MAHILTRQYEWEKETKMGKFGVKFNNFFVDIYQWFRYKSTSIKNLIYYFKVIWKDRDFDQSYFEDIIYLKLKKQYTHFMKENVPGEYVGMIQDIKAMRIALSILQRRKDDWYTNTWHDTNFTEDKNAFSIDDNGYLQNNGTEDENKKRTTTLVMFHSIEERDWKIFCNIMSKYFNNWWL